MASVLQTMREGSGTQHPEEIINFFNSRLVTASGIFDKSNNEFLVEESDTPAMSVDVRQGYAFIRKSSGQMVYPVWLKTDDATVAIVANASGNSRIDAIVLYVDLGATANPTISNVAKLIAVAGTPAGSPVAPDDTAILAAIGASNPYIVLAHVTVESGETTILDADISDQRTDATYTNKVGSIVQADGWIPYAAVTPTRASADDPTYVLTFAGVDLTTTIYPGMRVKWTQDGTVRFGIVTKMAFSTDTTMTIYGGTDYNVEDTATYAISAFYYSTQKAPAAFPLDPLKWSVIVADTAGGSQSNPTAGTWYNVGSRVINVPIGSWLLEYESYAYLYDAAGQNYMFGLTTLSTGNNNESDKQFTMKVQLEAGSNSITVSSYVARKNHITVSAKTPYYLNMNNGVGTLSSMAIGDTAVGTKIRATSAYL